MGTPPHLLHYVTKEYAVEDKDAGIARHVNYQVKYYRGELQALVYPIKPISYARERRLIASLCYENTP